MTEKQSSWGRVFFIERIEKIDSANTVVEREHIEKIINEVGSKFSAEPIDRRTVKNIRDVREAINDAGKVQNAIVHFSGHGREDPRRYELKDENGNEEFLKVEELSRFFNDFKNIRCVVFNFCNSLEFAKTTAKYVECAIGIAGTIASEEAIGFAEGFYKYLRDTEPEQRDVFYKAFNRGKDFSVGDDSQRFEIFLQPEVEIIEPKEDSPIPFRSDFKGTFKNLPENSKMWLSVYAPGAHKFYLVPIEEDRNYKTWEMPDHQVGREEDEGAEFKIGVIVIADEKMNNDWSTYAEKDGYFSLDHLPDGIRPLDERVVRRE
ncbi:hypothetical protein [Leptolyngbya ohadii]|uniref:hypothetical protein n=1 Tax=Leptolyngbya ohadii TaxID=1962290 RepID=UPI000B598BC6|nr:hypothetical protein [Leptolyngbya ohadii]